MKRLIALVLSLVMALSLCTPAWGVGESTSLPEAVNGVITLTEDVTVADGFTITEDTVLNLNGHTMTATGEKAYLLNVTGDANLTIYGGKLVAESTNHILNGTGTSTGASSSVYFNSTGRLTMTDVEVQGSVRGGHRAIQVFGGEAILTNVDITTFYGSGVNAGSGAYVVLSNCDITVNGMYSAPYNSVCFSMMNGGEMVINGGNYKLINDNTYATGDTHGGWVGIIMSSGGTLTINDGTFTNVPTTGFYPAYERAIFELENNDPAVATINFCGGTFDPQEDQIYGGYGDKYYPVYNYTENLKDNGDGTWSAEKIPTVAKIGIREYKTLDEAVANLKAGDTLTLLDDIALSSTFNVTKSVTIDGNGHKITNAGTTTNSAVLLGDSTWHEDMVDTCNITLKNAIFDGWATDHVVRVQGVKATIDNCTFQNCTSTKVDFGVVTLNYAEATVQNCTFTKNNCKMVVNVNYSVPKTTVLTKSNTIDNCVFTENTVSGVSVVYYSQGGGFVCKNSEFTKNVVNTSSHAAVVYGEVMTVTGNTFTENSVTATNERAGVVVADGGKVNENVFSNNTLSSAKYEATVVSKGDGFALDLNANYWGDGSAPAEGVDYVNAKPDEANTITATTYYSAVTADGKLSGLVDPNAPKPPVYNPTVTPETPTEKPVETPTETPTQPAPSTEVTVGGSESAVKVEATVTGTTATIDKIDTAQMETAIDSAADTGKVTIDFSAVAAAPESGEENAVVDTVEIPVEVIAQIAEAVADPENKTESLEIVLGDGASIEFDAAALAEKVAQAGGESIEISIKPTTAVPERLSSAQLFAVGESVAYDITVTSGGVAVSDMGGNITITAPYALAEGETAEGIVVYYVDDEGNREKCETTYDAATGRVSWVTNHLSVYMVAYEAPAADDGATDDGAVSDTPVVDDAQSSGSPALWIIIVVVVIVAIVVVVIISKKRKA